MNAVSSEYVQVYYYIAEDHIAVNFGAILLDSMEMKCV